MMTIRPLVISLVLLAVCYVCISFILLNGRLVYTTSFNESTIELSKKNDLFVTDDFMVVSVGDSLLNYKNFMEIWTNRRYEVKYFGALFHWTYTEPDWRYLNIEFKDTYNTNFIDWCIESDEGIAGCCDRFPCLKGDTIKISFIKCQSEYQLGSLTIVVN